MTTLKVNVIRKPTIKVKVLPNFPSEVFATSPILLSKVGGNFTFSFDQTASNSSVTIDASNIVSGTIPIARMPALTGDITTVIGNVATTLATVNVNVGTFGTATQVAQITANAKGLLTAVTNVTVTPAVGSVTGLGTGVATFLATPSSANLRAAVTDETGTGALVFAGGAIGAATATTLNGNTFTTGTYTLTGTAGKTLTFSNSITLAGTDATTMTFPTTTATLARTDSANTFTGTQTIGALVATTVNGLTVSASAGTLTIPNNASAALILSGNFSTTLTASGATNATLPSGTHTIVGQDTADTLTNKTYDSAGTGNVMKVSGVTISRGQYPGIATNTAPSAGNVDEPIVSSIAVGSAVSLTSTVAANITSISLTAGNWLVWINPLFGGTTTSVSGCRASISTTTGVESTTPGQVISQSFASLNLFATFNFAPGCVGPLRMSLSGTTTVFFVARTDYSGGTATGYGSIQAIRLF